MKDDGWTLDEALALAGAEVVSTGSYMHLRPGHVHEIYKCDDVYHVMIAFHTGEHLPINAQGLKYDAICGYTRSEFEATIVLREKSAFLFRIEEHENPCKTADNPFSPNRSNVCPVLPKGTTMALQRRR